MDAPSKPNGTLATKILPKPLMQAIQAVFAGSGPGVALVGGTALGGFYAGHRRSDDMGLFTADPIAQIMTVQAVKNLVQLGVILGRERTSPTYYHAAAKWKQHEFTIDVVLDPSLFEIGTFDTTTNGIVLANLETILKMKLATIVNRCGETDLFDLAWLFEFYRKPDVADILLLATEIDGGFQAESALVSLTGVKLRKEACRFAESFGVSAETVHEKISKMQDALISLFSDHLESSRQTPEIAKLIRALKARKKKH